MQKWEYLSLDNKLGYSCTYIPITQNRKSLHFNETICTEDYINILGEEGWEIVTAVERNHGNYLLIIFKRPVNQNSD